MLFARYCWGSRFVVKHIERGTDDKRVAEHKNAMRRSLLARRHELGACDRAAADAAIEANVLALAEFADAEVLLTYLDFGPEVRTHGIIQAAWAASKVVALPYCVPGTRDMRWYRITSFDGLVRSEYGVEEPVPCVEREQRLNENQHMLALVPGLSFDPNGYRLGYGGGYYDTFLPRFGGVSIGLCRGSSLSEDLRGEGLVDEHDVPVQLVVTDAECYTCGCHERPCVDGNCS